MLNILASSIGSLTNPTKLSNTFASEKQLRVSSDTIDRYLSYFVDAFLLQRAERYDVKGKKYIKTPLKYYFSDVGLRNARLGFRQQEETHIMENVLFNDLVRRGFDVDVGVVEVNTTEIGGKKTQAVGSQFCSEPWNPAVLHSIGADGSRAGETEAGDGVPETHSGFF